jgi:endonuclease YncB( thermonuclease family)
MLSRVISGYEVILLDGTNVNHMLAKDGWCWWYRKHAPGGGILEELETRARAAGLGLWADPQPVPPWEWRKRSRLNDEWITTPLYDRFTVAAPYEDRG